MKQRATRSARGANLELRYHTVVLKASADYVVAESRRQEEKAVQEKKIKTVPPTRRHAILRTVRHENWDSSNSQQAVDAESRRVGRAACSPQCQHVVVKYLTVEHESTHREPTAPQ